MVPLGRYSDKLLLDTVDKWTGQSVEYLAANSTASLTITGAGILGLK